MTTCQRRLKEGGAVNWPQHIKISVLFFSEMPELQDTLGVWFNSSKPEAVSICATAQYVRGLSLSDLSVVQRTDSPVALSNIQMGICPVLGVDVYSIFSSYVFVGA